MSASKWKPYPEYKPSKSKFIEEIPIHWNTKSLKGIIDQRRPITYGIVQCGPKLDSGVPYIRPADMTDEGGVEMENIQYTSQEIAAPYARSTIRGGDLVVSIGPSYGKVMTVPTELEGGNLTQGTARIAVNQSHYPDYFFWAMRSTNVLQQWDSLSQGATFRALNLEPLANTIIPVPPVSEQRKISEFIRRETKYIDQITQFLKREINLLEENRSVLIKQVATKGIDSDAPMKDSGIHWIGDIPKHWDSKKVKFASIIFRGKFGHRPRNDPKLYDGDYPFIQTGDVARAKKYLSEYKQTLNDLGRSVSEEFPSGTIVMAIAANIGDVAILTFDACFPDSIVGFNPNQNMSQEYLYYALFALANELDNMASKSTQQNLNIELVGNLTIPIPPKSEQIIIENYISNVELASFRSKEKIENLISRLKEYRTALISAVVTGKIDVREMDLSE